MRKFVYYILALSVCIVLCTITFFAFPGLQSYFLEENSVIENISAILYLLASMLCFYGFVKGINRVLCGVFCVFSGLGFMEELSFGKVIKHYPSPKIYGKDIDAIHDFLDVLVFSWNEDPAILLIILLVVAALVTIGFVALYRNKEWVKSFFTNVNVKSLVAVVVTVAILIITSQILDVEIINNENIILSFYEELLEMNAGLGLAFVSWILLDK